MKCNMCKTRDSENWYYLDDQTLCEDCKEVWFDKKIKGHYRYVKSLKHYDQKKDDKYIDRLLREIEDGRIEE